MCSPQDTGKYDINFLLSVVNQTDTSQTVESTSTARVTIEEVVLEEEEVVEEAETESSTALGEP